MDDRMFVACSSPSLPVASDPQTLKSMAELSMEEILGLIQEHDPDPAESQRKDGPDQASLGPGSVRHGLGPGKPK
jgi:hypothetical protein